MIWMLLFIFWSLSTRSVLLFTFSLRYFSTIRAWRSTVTLFLLTALLLSPGLSLWSRARMAVLATSGMLSQTFLKLTWNVNIGASSIKITFILHAVKLHDVMAALSVQVLTTHLWAGGCARAQPDTPAVYHRLGALTRLTGLGVGLRPRRWGQWGPQPGRLRGQRGRLPVLVCCPVPGQRRRLLAHLMTGSMSGQNWRLRGMRGRGVTVRARLVTAAWTEQLKGGSGVNITRPRVNLLIKLTSNSCDRYWSLLW